MGQENRTEQDEGECLLESIPLDHLREYVTANVPLRIEAGPMRTTWIYADCKMSVNVTKQGQVWADVHYVRSEQ